MNEQSKAKGSETVQVVWCGEEPSDERQTVEIVRDGVLLRQEVRRDPEIGTGVKGDGV